MTTRSTVISVENISKSYRLGAIGGATLKEDFARWWAKRLGKPDPLLRIGEEHRARHQGEHFLALRDVSFQVREGEVLGVIGRNGAGKSTLLKILSQVTSPTSGEIKIKGRIASLLEVGTGFHPELTGRENVFLNGAILGMTKAEIRRKFDEIVAFSDIEEFIDTPVKRYSSGMYVRLAFAVAAHLEPEILIVDEVLAVGDIQFQKKCLGKMQEVSGGGRTVLFVSHNMSAIQSLCTRCILMYDGQLGFDGDTTKATLLYQSSGVSPEAATGNGTYDLRNHKNEHSAKPVITGVTIRDHHGVPSNILSMGEALSVEIEVDGMLDFPNAVVAFRLLGTNDELLADFNTAMKPFADPAARARKETVRLHIPHFPFVQGEYKFGIVIGVIGVATVDTVEPVGRIEVIEHDVYGNGYQMARGHSMVLLHGDWTLSPRA